MRKPSRFFMLEARPCAHLIPLNPAGTANVPRSQKVRLQMVRAVSNNTIDVNRRSGCIGGVADRHSCRQLSNSNPDIAEIRAALAASSDP
jgi:hypothetical protein